MEISGKNPSVNLEGYINNIQSKKNVKQLSDKSQEQAKGDAAIGDNVVLSSRAREILEAKKLLEAVPDVREDKVALIKKKIEEGTYQVDEDKIAQKMLKESFLNQWL